MANDGCGTYGGGIEDVCYLTMLFVRSRGQWLFCLVSVDGSQLRFVLIVQ